MNTNITTQQFAETLNLSLDELQEIVHNAPRLYGKIVKTKPDGNKRYIYPPQNRLKSVQRILLNNILYKLPTPSCMGAGKGSSTKKVMIRHVDKKIVMRIDLSNFFPNIKSKQVFKLLRDRGFRTDVASIITRLTTYRGGLPQGAPCSTQLAKLALTASVKHILKLFSFPVDITFWVDDIVVSGPNSIKNFKETIYSILTRNGFLVNENKTGIMSDQEEQSALGIRVDRNRLEPDSKFMEKYAATDKSSEQAKGMRIYMHNITSP